MDKIFKKIAEELNIRETQVEATVKLIDEGNTIPFIARYRKEVTGNLSDEILRDLGERLTYLRNLEKRKEEIVRLIDEQGKLTDELTIKIAETPCPGIPTAADFCPMVIIPVKISPLSTKGGPCLSALPIARSIWQTLCGPICTLLWEP